GWESRGCGRSAEVCAGIRTYGGTVAWSVVRVQKGRANVRVGKNLPDAQLRGMPERRRSEKEMTWMSGDVASQSARRWSWMMKARSGRRSGKYSHQWVTRTVSWRERTACWTWSSMVSRDRRWERRQPGWVRSKLPFARQWSAWEKRFRR